jgi:hypothetical protein
MKFSDLFVPKYLHSDPKVRLKLIAKTSDVNLLEQMAVKDWDTNVKRAASERAQILKGATQRV